MLTSFPKLVALPRLQLLVLVLVLGAGLLPKNSLAAEKCAKELCTAEYPKECPKKPESKLEDCASGYCFQEVVEWNGRLGRMERRCASDQEVTCLSKVTGNCAKWDSFIHSRTDDEALRNEVEFRGFSYCMLNIKPKSAKGEEPANVDGDKDEEDLIDVDSVGQICACDKDNCNGDYTLGPPPPPPPIPPTPAPPSPPVSCYVTDCAVHPDSGKNPEDCLKAPETGAKAENCPTKHCYQHVEYEVKDGKPVSAVVKRDCASYGELACLQKRPGGCLRLRTDLNYEESARDRARLYKYQHVCLRNPPKPSPEGKSGGKGLESRQDRCVCTEDLCNGKIFSNLTLPGSVGVKHLGYNGVLVGALLTAVFPFRTLFLVV